MLWYAMGWDSNAMLLDYMLRDEIPMLWYPNAILWYSSDTNVSFAMDYVVSYMLELKVNEGECTQDFNLSLYSFSKVSLKVW